MKKIIALALLVTTPALIAGPCVNGLCTSGGKYWMYNCKNGTSDSTRDMELVRSFIENTSGGEIMMDYKTVTRTDDPGEIIENGVPAC